jgi:uncharacterized membrane protein
MGIHVNENIDTLYTNSAVFFVRVSVNIRRAQLPFIVFMGIMDTMAAFCFAIAMSKGMLSEVAVISSLYPAVKVILSAVIIKERIHRIQ